MTRAWMPMFVADYMSKTQHLSTEEHGAYLLLIFYYWEHGSIPSEDARLARICKLSMHKWKKIRPIILQFFDENFKHQRIEEELQKAREISEKRADAARAKAGKRHANAGANAQQKQTHSHTQSVVDTPQPAESPPPREQAGAAEHFEMYDVHEAYQEIVSEVWDASARRVCPAGTDGRTVATWRDDNGWTFEQITAGIREACERMKAQGRARPASLSYFTGPIGDGLHAGKSARYQPGGERRRDPGGEVEFVPRTVGPTREYLVRNYELLGHFGRYVEDAAKFGLTEEIAEAEIEKRKAEEQGRVQ